MEGQEEMDEQALRDGILSSCTSVMLLLVRKVCGKLPGEEEEAKRVEVLEAQESAEDCCSGQEELTAADLAVEEEDGAPAEAESGQIRGFSTRGPAPSFCHSAASAAEEWAPPAGAGEKLAREVEAAVIIRLPAECFMNNPSHQTSLNMSTVVAAYLKF